MRRDDDGFYYHTGQVKAIVGQFEVAGAPFRDAEDPRDAYAVRLKAGRPFRGPVTLATLKQDPRFRQFDLVKELSPLRHARPRSVLEGDPARRAVAVPVRYSARKARAEPGRGDLTTSRVEVHSPE